MVYLERKTEYGRLRHGLLTAIDLECYEWDPAKKAKIRATEATVPERLPVRMGIRRGAPLELPHVMLLVNDVNNLLLGAAENAALTQSVLYDSDLMLGAGHVTGRLVPDAAYRALLSALSVLNESGFLFAVGDGNHSLASAKAIWGEYQAEHSEARGTLHPLRYALVEIVNLYDAGLTFEPIHRVLFSTDAQTVSHALAASFAGTVTPLGTHLPRAASLPQNSACFIEKSPDGTLAAFLVQSAQEGLMVSQVQSALDGELKKNATMGIDYIHGEDELLRLVKDEAAVGVLLPPIDKTRFFSTISKQGVLPRKSFSMGEASEKRFYLECRSLNFESATRPVGLE
jgi:uncharacterized protein (DUF1015 family)